MIFSSTLKGVFHVKFGVHFFLVLFMCFSFLHLNIGRASAGIRTLNLETSFLTGSHLDNGKENRLCLGICSPFFFIFNTGLKILNQIGIRFGF